MGRVPSYRRKGAFGDRYQRPHCKARFWEIEPQFGMTAKGVQSSLRTHGISGHFKAKVTANIGITVTARSLPLNSMAVHVSSSQYRSVHTPPIQRTPEEFSLLHTGMKSAILRFNTLTVQSFACQGWGRAFESLHPLHSSQWSKASVLPEAFVFSAAGNLAGSRPAYVAHCLKASDPQRRRAGSVTGPSSLRCGIAPYAARRW